MMMMLMLMLMMCWTGNMTSDNNKWVSSSQQPVNKGVPGGLNGGPGLPPALHGPYSGVLNPTHDYNSPSAQLDKTSALTAGMLF